MSHAASISKKDVAVILSSPLKALESKQKIVLLALMAFGIVIFILGAATGDPRRAWILFHVNSTFWLCLAAASAGFSAVFHICNAQWVRPIRRVFESGMPYLALAWIPFLVTYLFGADHIFSWTHEVLPGGKSAWLNKNFLFARDIIGIWLLTWVTWKVVSLSLRRDIGAVRGGLVSVPQDKISEWKDAKHDWLVRGWGSDAGSEIAKATDRMGFFSPIVVIFYACVMALIAFDQIMSVDPHWFSTLFGAFVFMSAVYLAVAWTAVNVFFLRKRSPLYRAKVTRATLWDLGKLMFGFGIFWAYLFWSHYLTIWYGNLPEETGWIITRLRDEPWHSWAWTILGMCFIFPFIFGLSRDVKQVPELLALGATVVIVGLWLMFFLLVAPTIFPKTIPFGFDAIFITLGFGAAYFYLSRRFLERYPLIPFGDLYQK